MMDSTNVLTCVLIRMDHIFVTVHLNLPWAMTCSLAKVSWLRSWKQRLSILVIIKTVSDDVLTGSILGGLAFFALMLALISLFVYTCKKCIQKLREFQVNKKKSPNLQLWAINYYILPHWFFFKYPLHIDMLYKMMKSYTG